MRVFQVDGVEMESSCCSDGKSLFGPSHAVAVVPEAVLGCSRLGSRSDKPCAHQWCLKALSAPVALGSSPGKTSVRSVYG